MSCNQCQGIEKIFDSGMAKKEFKRYQKKGVTKTTQMMLDWITDLGQSELSLMDVGGGVGIIQHELFQAGVVKTAVHIDAALPYLEISKEEAERLGYADRVTYKHGDFVELAEDLGAADMVTLDRVLCCYHDMPALINAAASQAQQVIGLVFPRDRWWITWAMHLPNSGLWLSRNPFRFFVHSTTAVDKLLQKHGFQRQMHKEFFFWQSMVYVKQGRV